MQMPPLAEITEAEIAKNTIELKQELKEKKNVYDQLEIETKQIKSTHKTDIKEYHSLSKKILQLEDTIDSTEKAISTMQTKKQLIISNITDEYPYYLKAMSQRVLPSIMHSLILFLGFELEQEAIFYHLLKTGSNLKQLLENANLIQQTSNRLNKQTSNEHSSLFIDLKRKITNALMNNKKDLVYPFDVIYDYMMIVYELIDRENERDKHKEEIESMINHKNVLFVKLKQSENEIIKNESNLTLLDKHILQLNDFINKLTRIKHNNLKSEFIELTNSIELYMKKEKMFTTIPMSSLESTKTLSSFSMNNLAKSHNVFLKDKQTIPVATNFCLSTISKHKDNKRHSINFGNNNKGHLSTQKKNNQRSVHSFHISQIRQQFFNNIDQKIFQPKEKDKDKDKTKNKSNNIMKNKVFQLNNRYSKYNDKCSKAQTQKSSNMYEEDTSISPHNNQIKDNIIDKKRNNKMNLNNKQNHQEFTSLLSNQTQNVLFNSISNDIYINNNIDSVCDELVSSQKEFIKRQTSKLISSSPIGSHQTRNIRHRNDLNLFCVEKSVNPGGCCVSCT